MSNEPRTDDEAPEGRETFEEQPAQVTPAESTPTPAADTTPAAPASSASSPAPAEGSAPAASPDVPARYKAFVGGLSWDTTDGNFKQFFSQFGTVTDSVVMRKGNGASRGFGFVTFAEAEALEKVVGHDLELDNRRIDVKNAVPQGEAGARGSGGNGGGRDRAVRTKKIFVGGVSPETTQDDFRKYFEQFGTIVEAKIMVDHYSGRSRGFGFVSFENEETVESIVENKSHTISGKAVECKKAQPKRPMHGGYGRGNYAPRDVRNGMGGPRGGNWGGNQGNYGRPMGGGYGGPPDNNQYGLGPVNGGGNGGFAQGYQQQPAFGLGGANGGFAQGAPNGGFVQGNQGGAAGFQQGNGGYQMNNGFQQGQNGPGLPVNGGGMNVRGQQAGFRQFGGPPMGDTPQNGQGFANGYAGPQGSGYGGPAPGPSYGGQQSFGGQQGGFPLQQPQQQQMQQGNFQQGQPGFQQNQGGFQQQGNFQQQQQQPQQQNFNNQTYTDGPPPQQPQQGQQSQPQQNQGQQNQQGFDSYDYNNQQQDDSFADNNRGGERRFNDPYAQRN